MNWQVSDVAGAFDNITFTINVNDTNEPPTCTELMKSTTASVQDDVDYVVTTLSCTDPDFTPVFSTLSYSIEGNPNITSKVFTIFLPYN